MRRWIATAALFALGCTAHDAPPTTITARPPQQIEVQDVPAKIQDVTAEVQNVPVRDVRKDVQTLASLLVGSAWSSRQSQPMFSRPSAELVLYLMRAASYSQAAALARKADQSEDMRFVGAKARVLAHECSAEQRCSTMFDDLSPGNADLRPVFSFWKTRALIEDGLFADALSATNDYILREKNGGRSLVLALCSAYEKAGGFDAPTGESPLSGDKLKSLDQLAARMQSSGNAFESASLIHCQMEIARSLGNTRLASQKAMALIQRYPATQMSLWPELYQQQSIRLSHSERYSRCAKLISHFDYDNARRELSQLLDEKNLTQALRDKAELELARISMTNSEAPGLSESIYRKWAAKKGSMQEEATFGISRALSRQLRYEDAIKALNQYDRKYPRGKYHMRSLYLRGWYLFDLRRNEEARPLLLEYAEATNDTSVWGFYAQSFLRDQMWSEAIDAFQHLKGNSNPIVRGKALYWQAYANHALGHDDRAGELLSALHREFPLTWYDMLAYEREHDWFGADEEEAFRKLFRLREDPPTDTQFYAWGHGAPVAGIPTSALWKRIETLARYDAIEEARALYQQNEATILSSVSAASRDEFRRYATHLVESYNKAWEDVAGSIRAFSSTMPERSNARHKLAYPQPFAPLVESLASKYGLPPYFIYGIMLQESRFRPWQVSTADAIGALQMIPKTARPIAGALGLEYHPDTFFDPRVGFPYSAYYMKMHYERWGHNLTFTAGSYNGGPHRIGPWALRDKGRTIDIIVDEFSFDESRHYARKVAEHTLRFAYLYATTEDEWMSVVHRIVPRIVPDIVEGDGWGL